MRGLALAGLVGILTAGLPAMAQNADSDIVRLPGQGTLKTHPPGPGVEPPRFVPGGGLLLSFDADRNGEITPAEREAGTLAAFSLADKDESGTLSAFEQQEWAENLPTHDDSLANPVRFDPNLDRMVSLEEFSLVIEAMAGDYASEETGILNVEDLRDTRRPQLRERPDGPPPGGMPRGPGN